MNIRLILNLMVACLLIVPLGARAGGAQSSSALSIAQPVLKWANKGCYNSWCETGWYSSPAVADLDSDGQAEIIASAYSIVVLDGATGSLKLRLYSGHDRSDTGTSNVGRTWPGVVVANIDNTPGLEIVTSHGGGWLSVYNHLGDFKPGWPRQVTPGNELRSLGVYDLDNDGKLEIMTASTRAENQWYVFQPDGSLRPAFWPQHSPDSNTNGYTSGCFNQNIAAGDIDGDGRGEIVGPNDTHYIAAFQDDGSQVTANTIYGTNPGGTPKVWSRVGVHVEHAVDLRGYANCGSEHRPNFANSAPVIIDVNGDGSQEVVVIGNVYNCGTSPYTDLYEIPFIFQGDRTRWKSGAYDWTILPAPSPGSAPLSQDYNLIENNQPNPVVVDLDGDGLKEILYPSYDGRMHAYWLDRTQHGNWPYAVTKPGEGVIRFASEPVVADLDNNGQAEVIFTSWPQKNSGLTGKLHILDSMGTPIWEVALPGPFGGSGWNGALAAPTLANVDQDPDLEVVVNTARSGVVVYDLPGTAGARVLWATGRGNFQRSGSLLRGSLAASSKSASNITPEPGDLVQFTITLRNDGPALSGVTLSDTIPAGLVYQGGLSATTGSASYAGGAVTWSGSVSATPVTIRYQAQVAAATAPGSVITNTAVVKDSQEQWQLKATVMVSGKRFFLPLVFR